MFGVIQVHIQSKHGKIKTRITPNSDTFYAVIPVWLEIMSMIQIEAGHNGPTCNTHIEQYLKK